MNDHWGALGALIVAVVLLTAGIIIELRRNRQARRRAMRRHPAVRFNTSVLREGYEPPRRAPDFTSDAARKYHKSNQFGR